MVKCWIVRHLDGRLSVFRHNDKPFKHEDGGWRSRCYDYWLPRDWFPDVTYDNSPMEVELVIKK